MIFQRIKWKNNDGEEKLKKVIKKEEREGPVNFMNDNATERSEISSEEISGLNTDP